MSLVCTHAMDSSVSHHAPRVGIKLTGDLSGWATTKDLILYLTGKLTVKVRNPLPRWDTTLSVLRVGQAAFSNTSVLGSSNNRVPVSWKYSKSLACSNVAP